MAYDYSNHSRFFFGNYNDIQDHINSEDINPWDIIICEDTKEMILVTDKFELIPIQSKVYRFTSINDAESYLNEAGDTYQGQLVSILSVNTGTYQAYVVNKNNSGRYYVSAISVYNASDIDYNEIGHRPIEQISGNIEQPVILSQLSDGLYKVEGAYKVCTKLQTIFQTYNGDMLSVTHNQDGTTSIKVITSSSIIDYLIDANDNVIDRGNYATKEWVEAKGYTTVDDMNTRLEALNIITKDEALEYIQALIREGVELTVDEVVDEVFNDTFNARFDQRLRETLVMEDQQNIRQLF